MRTAVPDIVKPASRLAPGTIAARDFSQSLARGLAILELFRDKVTYLTPSIVATEIGVSRAAARRLLLTLQDLGYLQGDDRRFWLTPHILRLGQNLFAVNGLWPMVNHRVVELANQFNEPCAAAVLDGLEIVYVARDAARHIYTSRLAIGDRMPAHCSSLGKILLAALPLRELDTLIATRPLIKRTDKTIVDPAALKQNSIECGAITGPRSKARWTMERSRSPCRCEARAVSSSPPSTSPPIAAAARSRAMVQTMLSPLQIAAQDIEVIIRAFELRGPR